MNFQNLLMEIENGIATITINRPPVNALNMEALDELKQAFNHLGAQTDVQVIIITGAGEKAFVAGADIKEMLTLNQHGGHEYALRGQGIFRVIENFDEPVIAAINGFALGGGCELAMACHIRIASSSAKFSQPEVGLGLIPGFGGTQRLPRLVGKGRALELLLTGEMIDAIEACRIGLVNKVVSPEDLMPTAKNLAKRIISNAPKVQKIILRLVKNSFYPQGDFNQEAIEFSGLIDSADGKEGMTAFIEKRAPVWTNQ